MRVTYFVACSLDGYIADPEGGVDWLEECQTGNGGNQGYEAFFSTVNGLVMGRKTFDQILGFGDWPYGEIPCWVMTRRPLTSANPAILPSASDPAAVLAEAKTREVSHVWVVGGAEIAGSFLEAGVMTDLIISLMPVILGDGIPLLPRLGTRHGLKLERSTPYPQGWAELHYTIRPAKED